MKVYKTARGILNASIRDIEAGLWICHELSCMYDPNGLDVRRQGSKPMGCAIGLVAINGGVVKKRKRISLGFNEHGKEVIGEGYVAQYPSRTSNVPQAVFDAITALAKSASTDNYYEDTIRRYSEKSKTEASRRKNTHCAEESIVIDHNDDDKLTPEEAVDWFKDALALL